MTTERLTPESEARVRQGLRSGWGFFLPSEVRVILNELDATRRELDEAQTITDAMVETVRAAMAREYGGPNLSFSTSSVRRALEAATAKDGDK